MINSRIFSKYLKSLNKDVRGEVIRDGKLFLIHFNKNGNKLTTRSKEVAVSFKSQSVLNKGEIDNLKHKDTKLSFPIKVGFNPQIFGLEKFYFYPDQDAADLAKELENKGMIIPRRVFTSSFRHDLELNHKKKSVLIEITRKEVSPIYQANFKHQSAGGNIRAHIFDVYHRCVIDKIKGKNSKVGFVIISKGWKKIKHIYSIVEECKLVGCHILFSDFKEGWAVEESKKILETIR